MVTRTFNNRDKIITCCSTKPFNRCKGDKNDKYVNDEIFILIFESEILNLKGMANIPQTVVRFRK